MKKITKAFLFGLFVLLGSGAFAQSQSDMRINEILVLNTNDFVDDFGHKNGWIELFNTSYGTIDIGGCYLSNDPDNLKKYMIPKGDVLTRIKPRQHILFWADNEPFRGTFHINFKLEDSQTVYLTSSDGRTILDMVHYPTLTENVSYGRKVDGIGDRVGKKGWGILPKTSPSTNNKEVGLPKGLQMLEYDPSGAVMAVTAMSVVFLALILLYLVFKGVGKYAMHLSQKKATLAAIQSGGVAHTDASKTSAEVFAAIAVAMELYQRDDESHDIENTILTIEKVKRNYSPWSSKIYTLRETPNKK